MADDAPLTYGTQRKVAARNRVAILDAAHDLFAEDPGVALSEVARVAGVGAGTLYRHFPTREDLILAVYHHDIERLSAAAADLLARHHSARAAFVEWFETLSGYVRIKHGLGEALHSAAAEQVIATSWDLTTAAVGELVAACVEEGTIAPGHDPADVIMLMSFLWRLPAGADGEARGRRLIEVVFEGLVTAPGATA